MTKEIYTEVSMDDTKIIDLYWQKNPMAIEATAQKYGNMCRGISYNILGNEEDAEECVNDSYMTLWKRIPPERPIHLRAYLVTITRNLCLDRLRERTSKKRGGGETAVVLDELSEYIAAPDSVEKQIEAKVLSEHIRLFVQTLSPVERTVFLARYWLFSPIADIAHKIGWTESRVKTSLFRTRKKLQKYLMKEGLL